MFLLSMESILIVKKLSIDYTRIIFNMMKVWNLFYSSLASIESANQILPNVIQLSNDIVDDNPLVIENEGDFSKLNDNNTHVYTLYLKNTYWIEWLITCLECR